MLVPRTVLQSTVVIQLMHKICWVARNVELIVLLSISRYSMIILKYVSIHHTWTNLDSIFFNWFFLVFLMCLPMTIHNVDKLTLDEMMEIMRLPQTELHNKINLAWFFWLRSRTVCGVIRGDFYLFCIFWWCTVKLFEISL